MDGFYKKLKDAKASQAGTHAALMRERHKMNFENYREAARKTRNSDLSDRDRLANWAMSLSGEAGEVANIVKKHLYHEHPFDQEEIKDELSDVLWYLDALADECGLSLVEIAQHNVNKLKARYGDKFSPEKSINRVD